MTGTNFSVQDQFYLLREKNDWKLNSASFFSYWYIIERSQVKITIRFKIVNQQNFAIITSDLKRLQNSKLQLFQNLDFSETNKYF